MKRTRQESRDWDTKIRDMFTADPETKLVKNRYRAIRWLLTQPYNDITTAAEKERLLSFLKDAVYLDRRLRLATEGLEDEMKQELSENYQVEELGY